MLISKSNYDAGDVITFKLVNGDEIIARVVEQTTTGFVVDRPCTVMPSAKGIGLIQSMFTSETARKVSLDNQHVLMHAPTIKDMVAHYTKTTSGIELVV